MHSLLLGGSIGWIAFGGIPENDHFSLRARLGPAKGWEVTGSNYAASREDGEPLHAGFEGQSGSVWWSWRPPDDASDVLVDVKLAGGDPLLAVYTGFAVDKLELVAESNKGALSFVPVKDTDYHFAVAGDGRDAEGAIKLQLQAFTDEDSEATEIEDPSASLPEIVIEEEEPESRDFIRTSQNERLAEAPKDANFESDRNTAAASELAPEEEGMANLPSQDGIDLPHLEMADREFADGEIGDDATIPIAAVEIYQPQLPQELTADKVELKPLEEAKPEMTAENLVDEEFMADTGDLAAPVIGEVPPEEIEGDAEEMKETEEVAEAKPEPEKEEVAEAKPPSQQPVAGKEEAEELDIFQPQTRRNKVVGTISNRGKSSVSAAETPLGKYTRAVTGAVEKRWHQERRRNSDFVSYGNMKVTFQIGKDGKPRGLKIIEDNADPIMVDFTLGAILTADVPPMPESVRELLADEPLEISYEVILY